MRVNYDKAERISRLGKDVGVAQEALTITFGSNKKSPPMFFDEGISFGLKFKLWKRRPRLMPGGDDHPIIPIHAAGYIRISNSIIQLLGEKWVLP